MARTITEIKDTIASAFMGNETAAKKFGFTRGSDFSATFSKVSFVGIFFSVFASAVWVLESLFDAYKKEVEERIDEIVPHTARWYTQKVLAFMMDKELIPDTDRYDTTGMSDAEIDKARVVKHCVAFENKDSSFLVIKVKGENGVMEESEMIKLRAYIEEIRDAGVRFELINSEPDEFNCDIDIYYNPMLEPETIKGECEKAVSDYINNLPFNGQYTNMGLIDKLQQVEGVRIAELRMASRQAAGFINVNPINGYCVPEAGYFTEGDININMIVHG